MRWRGLVAGCCLWLLGGVVQAQNEDQVYPATGLQVFLGLDDTSAPTQVADGRAQAIQNVQLGIGADARKRPGLDLIGTDGIDTNEDAGFCDVAGLTYAPFIGGTERIVAICGRQSAYFDTTLSPADWTSILPTPQGYIFTPAQNTQFVFKPALSQLIATNDVDPPYQWDGTATGQWQQVSYTGLTNPIQRAKTVSFFRNFLIFGNIQEGGTRYPTRVRWSNVGTINTWTVADNQDIDAPAGQELNCMGELSGDLYLGFTSSLYRMSFVGGSFTFNFTKVSDSVGCVAKNSMQQITLQNAQTGLIFLDRQSRVYFSNGGAPVEVSALIHGTMDGFNLSRLPYAVSAEDGERYFLCVTGSGATANNTCLDFNYYIGEWSKHTFGININAMAKVRDSTGATQVYIGSTESFLYQLTKTSLDNDVGGFTGTIDAVSSYVGLTESTLQVLYDADQAFTVSGLVGAPIELVGGTASGLTAVIVDNTSTGLVVTPTFSTTPDTTTTYSTGAIDAFYTTKWYHLGSPVHLKQDAELYLWADADIGSTLDVGYAFDFQSNTAVATASLTPATGSLWGTGIWGTAVWGGGSIVFRNLPLNDDGRYVRYNFAEDDVNENFRMHGFATIYRQGDIR